MAGWGTVFSEPMHRAFGGRILNTHPALLPAFPGWHAVRDALAAGVKVTGCTVHVAGLEVDTGPILAQEAVEVRPDDTEASLHERIKAVERRIYPATIGAIVRDPTILKPHHPDEERTVVRALLSVYDKSGIVDLARGLADAGWDLVSSGGTAKALAEAGLAVTDTAEITGFPAILGHRVVTLHPKVHGGILADRTDPEHVADLEKYGIEPFDLVVVNLYPFSSDPGIELIDIGGPAMVRAAAKNFSQLGVVVDPADYSLVLDEVRGGSGISPATRRSLARKAFSVTAAYDAEIVEWLDRTGPDAGELPATLHLSLEQVQVTRYGENPHQRGARYRRMHTRSWWDDVEQHSGLAMSYLNLYDADAAWRCVHDLGDQPAVVIVKHANPCGVALGDDLADAYQRAYDCDSRSAFGGIVALNKPVDAATVEHIVAAAQADLIIAPGYDEGVVESLIGRRKNTRVLVRPGAHLGAARAAPDRWGLPGPGRAHLRGHAGRLAGRHPAPAPPTPSGPTPSWRGASSAG